MATPRRKTPRRDARTAARRKTILELRVEGLTFAAIGARLGISAQAAHESLKKELRDVAAERKDLAEHQLEAELAAIDFVIAGMAPKVAKGDAKAATAYLRAMERRAKLLGLDAPEKHHHSGSLNTDPTALHARLGAIATRAAREADADAAREAEPAREG